jgi:hypothetical protein
MREQEKFCNRVATDGYSQQVCLEVEPAVRRGMLFSQSGCSRGFDTFLNTLKGGVLNPLGTNKKQIYL